MKIVKTIIKFCLFYSFRGTCYGKWLSKNKFLRFIARRRLIHFPVHIGANTKIGKNFIMDHPQGIVIGGFTRLGDNCKVYQNVTIGQKNNKYPIIGNNVVIYANSVVFGDIHIGDNVVIGAGSVVDKSIPDNCTVAGNPAKIIKSDLS